MAYRTARNVFFIFVIASLVFAGCGNDSDRQVAPPPDEVEQELGQFELVRMLEGKTKWRLKAETATFLESDVVIIEVVELLIFGDKEGETLTIHGDRGEVNQRTNDIKIVGNVEGISSDGGHLSAEEIYWRERTGKIYTLPGIKVTITYQAFGKGLSEMGETGQAFEKSLSKSGNAGESSPAASAPVEDSVIVGEELEADPELETATLKRMTGTTRSEEKESENLQD